MRQHRIVSSLCSLTSLSPLSLSLSHTHTHSTLIFTLWNTLWLGFGPGFAGMADGVVWVRGPGSIHSNGVLVGNRRLLTARAGMFTYHEASLSHVEFFDGQQVVSAPCRPDKSLITNNSLDFSIVSVPQAFERLSGVGVTRLGEHSLRIGQRLFLVQKTGTVDCGRASRTELSVADLSENEVFCQLANQNGEVTLGCPIFDERSELVALVVKVTHERGLLRAMRISALLRTLKKRLQLEDALGIGDEISSEAGADVRVICRTRRFGTGQFIRLSGFAIATLLGAAVVWWDLVRKRRA